MARHALVADAVEDDVLVDLVGEDEQILLVHQRAERRESSGPSTAPVGLCGVLSMIIRVRGVTARRTSSQSIE